MALGCLGSVIALILIEVGLRSFPTDQLDSIIERSSQRLQLYRLDPRIGWRLKSNARSVHTTREDVEIPIAINSLGLRDSEHTYEKPPDTYRILILGDSFAEALDVELEESFPYLVEQCLNQRLVRPVEVINGGVSGYTTADEYLFYKSDGIKYNPDLTLLTVYIGNDFRELGQAIGRRLAVGFGGYKFNLENKQLSQTWISWGHPGDETSPIELILRRYSLLYRVLAYPESKIHWSYRNYKTTLQQWLGSAPKDQKASIDWDFYIHTQDFSNNPHTPQKTKDVWDIFRAVVQQLKQEVEDNSDELAMILLPTDYQVDAEVQRRVISEVLGASEQATTAEWRVDEPNISIMREMEQQSIPTLDLQPYFLAHDQQGGAALYFEGFFDEHLNRDGQKLMADVICDWLVHNQAIRLPRSE
jgi:hypothetical protein